MRKKVLVTGGAGFIGSEFLRQGVKKKYSISVVDKITYAGDLARLWEVKGRYSFHRVDIGDFKKLELIFKKEKPSVVVHFAAETHVDRSIQNVHPFIQANITGTQNLIDLARRYKVKKFIHISTDEVYGESKKGRFKEDSSPIHPNNPYSATKAAAELLIKAAIRTYHFPAIIIRPSNNYGPWQYPEKFIPVIILKAMQGEKIPVYGKGKQVREWLHVSDCARAIHLIIQKGKIGEVYNIGSYFEQPNIKTAKKILKLMGKESALIQFVQDRPGHDFRYSVDCRKIFQLGWKPTLNFNNGIQNTIQWYLTHYRWIEHKHAFLKTYWKKVYFRK